MEEVEEPINYVGKTLRPAGHKWEGVVVSQKYINDGKMLLVYFENKFCCNAEICKVIEKEEVQEIEEDVTEGEEGTNEEDSSEAS